MKEETEHSVRLNNGYLMPLIGFGTLHIKDEKVCEECIYEAIRAGYRMIDTAAAYDNETAIGRGIARAIADKLITRDELFLVTKLWIQDANESAARAAALASMKNLQVDYLDLYLIHQPYGDYYGAWRAMEKMVAEGLISSIGVCNFSGAKLVDLILGSSIKPAVNQIEIHPFFLHENESRVMKEYEVTPIAWGPLSEGQRNIFHLPLIENIGKKYNKTSAQVILRWEIQKGISVIPKTVQKSHLHENIDIWDFVLSEEDISKIETLNIGHSEIIDHNSAYTAKWLNQWKIHE